MFWWAHLFIAGITVILTTLALATKEIYKYTVTVNKQNYPMFDIVVYINYWKLQLETKALDAAALAGITPGSTTHQEVDVTCCITVNLPPATPAFLLDPTLQLVDFSAMDKPRCGHLHVLQATTVVVMCLSVFATCCFLAARRYKAHFPRAGWIGRLAFAISSLVSVLSIIMTADLRSKIADSVASNSLLGESKGELVYSWGYYVWVVAMVIKLIAAVLVIYEVFIYKPDGNATTASTDVGVPVEVDLEESKPEEPVVPAPDDGTGKEEPN